MTARPRHTRKEVEEAVEYAESLGWVWKKQGHWGRLYCPQADRDGCQIGVYGTPRNSVDHARQIFRAIDRCPHRQEDENDEDI